MPVHYDKAALLSTVKNTSGVSKVFGFLPPHGVRLEAGEEYTVFGNILEALVRGDRSGDRRNHVSFLAAIDANEIEIVQTPNPVLKDTVTGATKMLKLASGTLSAAAPSWQTSDSLDVDTAP